jgi:hypothetical protein
MFEIFQEYNQIFLIGLTGSGKSFIADKISKELNKEFYGFDEHWDYTVKEKKANIFLNEIRDKNNIVVDGIPYDEIEGVYIDNIFTDFLAYDNGSMCVVCVFFEDVKKWIKTILNKRYYKVETISLFDGDYFIKQWCECYEKSIDILMDFKNLFFYNIDNGEILDRNNFKLKREQIKNEFEILKGKTLLRSYLSMLKQEEDYDAYYQDIECINFKGYSVSFKTWKNIKDFEYDNKIMMDIGCNHGYFTFKTAKTAKCIYGVDISNRVLDFCNILLNVYDIKNVKFYQWDENLIPDNVDMVLCLNVLHHFKDIENFFNNLKIGVEVIFEIEDDQKKLIEKYFEIKKELNSHRENRIILYGVKR